MPEPTNYVTLDGEPPNGGVPPNRLLVSVPQPVDDPPNDGVPPNNAVQVS